MSKKYEGIIHRLTSDGEVVRLKDLEPGESICVETVEEHGRSYLYTVYRPPRRKNESPIRYYTRTGCVDDSYYHRWHGQYYCNPAHCRKRWKNKKERDAHLDMAYAILG